MADLENTGHNYYLALAKVKKLEARVEELEGENESIRAKIKFLREGSHRITDEQIDELVAWANVYSRSSFTRGERWLVLNKLNIFQCLQHNEGMGGCPRCAKFTGHGWTIGDKNG
jgi:hypothetical protein